MIRERPWTFHEKLEPVLKRVSKWRFLQAIHRLLSPLPFERMLVLGLFAGLLLGAVSLQLGTMGGFLVAALTGFALLVGLTAQPVWVEAPVETVVTGPLDLFEMVDIDGGTFLMGSPEDEPDRSSDERLHEVTVSGFRMSKTTVTRAQYAEFMEIEKAPGPGGPDHPVTKVSWHDAVAFCNHASEKAGFEPCYTIDGDTVEWRGGNGYRLPTEAEWEYAARAGTRTRWSFGDDEAKLGEYAWFGGNSERQAHPVAQLTPNPWGLFDMHGNVWEWCWDVYGEYPRGSVKDPRGASESSSGFRVLRGGAFWLEPRYLRSALRLRLRPRYRLENVGFRCIRVAPPQP